jgi:septum site-determining protein MinD
LAGYIISIVGGKGGVGKSQIAANLAYAFASELRSSSLLLDFDQKACGDQDMITGIKAKKTLKELAEFSGAIDPKSLQAFVTTSAQKVSFIGMPKDSTAAQYISDEALGKFLKAVKNIYPITIIDTGGDLTPLALKALEFSTMIMMVVSHDLIAVNQAKKLNSELTTLLFPKEMIQIVSNMYQKGHPVTPEIIGAQLGKTVFSIIPKDDQTCIYALSKSQPAMVTSPESAFARSILECVRKIQTKNVLPTLEKIVQVTERPKPDTANLSEAESKASLRKNPWIDLKSRIHKSLVEDMDLKSTGDAKDPKSRIILREQTKKMVVEILNKEYTKGIINRSDYINRVVKEVLYEDLGLGP